MSPQNERILNYLELHGSITALEAEEYLGIRRLASRINELNMLGYNIGGIMVSVQNRYGEKCLIKRYFKRKRC